jgi:hypothetical protein
MMKNTYYPWSMWNTLLSVLVVSIFLEEHDKWAYPLIHADAVEYIFIRGGVRILGGVGGGWWEVFVILLILVVASIRNNPLHDFD